MKRVSLAQEDCPVARSLDLLGEWWTLLILRECFTGMSRFDDFQKKLEVPKNTLTERLAKLVNSGILARVPVESGGRRMHYKLTEMGKELYVVFLTLRQWGDKWLFDGNPPHAVVERETGRPIAPVEARSVDGRILKPRDTMLVPLRPPLHAEGEADARAG